MKNTTPEYTTVDLSRWARKEHYEAFQGFAQCTFSQTVQIDITALKTYTGCRLEILPYDNFPSC
jgi:chloramphenicol O-acetyltransferase